MEKKERPGLIVCGHCRKEFHAGVGFCPFCKTPMPEGPSRHEDLLRDLASGFPRTFHSPLWVVLGACGIALAGLALGVPRLSSHVGTLDKLGGETCIAIAVFLLSRVQLKVTVTPDDVRLRRLVFTSRYPVAEVEGAYVEERRWLLEVRRYAKMRLKAGRSVEVRVAEDAVDPFVAAVEKALLVFRARHPQREPRPSGDTARPDAGAAATRPARRQESPGTAAGEAVKLDESLRWRRSRFGPPEKIEILLHGYFGEEPVAEVLVRFPAPSAQAGMADNLHCIGTFSSTTPPLIGEITEWARRAALQLGLPAPLLTESYTFRRRGSGEFLPREALPENLEAVKRRFPGMAVTAVTVSEDRVVRHGSHTVSVAVRLGGGRGVECGLGTFDFAHADAARGWAERLAAESGVSCRFFQSSD